ncbi:MAG: hypothetical protein RLY30_662 [Pseudomonadota bacterium]
MSSPSTLSRLSLVWPFGFAYALSYGLRTISAVLAPELERELGLSAADLGFLASAYFLSFAVMQIPIGLALDRQNPVRLERALLLVALLGCLLSALSTGFWSLWLGRAMIGIGVSACLMAAYKAFRLEFPPQLQAPLASVMLVLGSAGALASTLPVNQLLTVLPWNGVFGLLAGLFGLSWWVLRRLEAHFEQPERRALRTQEPISSSIQSLLIIVSDPAFRRLIPFAVLSYGGFLAFHGLWLGPWLTQVEGASTAAAAADLFWLTAVIMLGHLGWAALTRASADTALTLDQLMRMGLTVFVALCLMAGLSLWESAMIGWGLAFLAAGSTTLGYSVVALSFPIEQSARATTAFNFLVFAGAFLMQWGMGIVVDLALWSGNTTATGLQWAVVLWVIGQALALAWLQFRPARRLP